MSNPNKIAIIGLSGQFPGASDIYEMWDNVFNDRNCIKNFSRSEIDQSHDDFGYTDSKKYRFVGGYPEDTPYFDAAFFGISPKEALFMDPQHRKFLEHSYLALEHAGYNPLKVKTRVGVFASEGVNSYLLNNIIDSGNWQEEEKEMSIYGGGYDYLATRVSYLLNLNGPSFTVQSGCSGSLVAVHMAVQSLLSYESDMALAGGVSILTPIQAGYMFQENGILSENGVCRPFDYRADGTIFTNGYGVVVLKRLEDAIEEKDNIICTIIGSAINNDGNDKISYSAPSVSGQRNVIKSAISIAEIDPNQIGYIECHGTGTHIGDPIEFRSLADAFGHTINKNSCVISSVKSNIGHLNTASGIAGLVKAIGCISYGKLPSTINYEKINEEIDIDNSPFKILKQTKDWISKEPKVAGVSSFGVGGTNCHVLIEEYTSQRSESNVVNDVLFLLTAKTESSLKEQVKNWKNFLEKNNNISLDNLFFTLSTGRPTFEYKICFKISSVKDLISKLDSANITHSESTGNEINACDVDLETIKNHLLKGDHIVWDNFFKNTDFQRIPLPTYSFDKDCYWLDIKYRCDSKKTLNRKNPDINEWFYTPMFVEDDFCKSEIDINKKWLILEDGNFISNQLIGNYPELNLITVNVKDIKDKNEYIKIFKDLELSNFVPDIIIHGYSLKNFDNITDQNILHYGLFSLLYLVQALSLSNLKNKCRLVVLADKIASLVNEDISPLKSTIFGVSKTINKEYDYNCCVFDIDNVKNIGIEHIGEIYNGVDEFAIFRGKKKFIEKYRSIHLPNELSNNLSVGTYIITGGFGYFGLDIAKLISEKVSGSKIVLISRSKFPPKAEWESILTKFGLTHGLSKKIIQLKEIEKNNCCVFMEQANVSDFSVLNAIFAKKDYENIKGIIHAAGVVDSSVLDRKQISSFDTLFDAKVWGSINIVKISEKYNPNFVLLCSSINSIIGGLGQADNTASTSFVDYFARYCRNKGNKNIFAINWGVVNQSRPRDFESLPEFRELSEEHYKNRMTDTEREIVFGKILNVGKKWHRIIVSTIDLNKILEEWNKVSTVDALIKDKKIALKKRSEMSNLASLEVQHPSTEIEKYLCECFSNILGIDIISTKDNFFELGGHSLSAIRLNEKIKNKFDLRLHAMTVYELPILSQLAGFIQEQTEAKF